ncbi:hypothetical protein BDV18DRAFT_136193 [Aspergillus unguis]
MHTTPAPVRPSHFRRFYTPNPRYRRMGFGRLTKAVMVGALGYFIFKKVSHSKGESSTELSG